MEDEELIRELVNKWLSATKAGDINTVLSLMTDDVIFMVPNKEPFGKVTFKSISEQSVENIKYDATIEIKEIKVLGDWAYVRNYIKISMFSPDGTSIQKSGYTLSILQKDADGNWKISRDANLLTMG